MREIEMSIVMPCLNEAATLRTCILQALRFFEDHGIVGEVVVADNGSTDSSVSIAESLGARVTHVSTKGYGAALKAGIQSAKGKYVAMGDSDESYDFSSLFPFLEELRNGVDLVMGNRFKGGIDTHAMPFLHRYLGNPVLSFLGRVFFRAPVGDFYCGLRMFSKEAYERMSLRANGMEFAYEMVVKSSLKGLVIKEVPTTLKPDGRGRPPHLKTWRDGWRSLKFLLTFSPKWLFFYPGIVLILLGTGLISRLYFSDMSIGEINVGVQTMLYGAGFLVVGMQSVWFYVLANAVSLGVEPEKIHNPDRWMLWSVAMLIVGGVFAFDAINGWREVGFGDYLAEVGVRRVIPSVACFIVGFQSLFNAFFYNILITFRNE